MKSMGKLSLPVGAACLGLAVSTRRWSTRVMRCLEYIDALGVGLDLILDLPRVEEEERIPSEVSIAIV